MLWAIAVCGDRGQAAEMVKARNRLPDTVLIAPPGFLVGRRRKAVYDTSAIEFAADLGGFGRVPSPRTARYDCLGCLPAARCSRHSAIGHTSWSSTAIHVPSRFQSNRVHTQR